MTKEEFDNLMNEVDRAMAARGISAFGRMGFALKEIDPSLKESFPGAPVDPRLGPYEGNNLCHAVSAWYEKHYSTQVTIGKFGQRPIVIRAEVFTIVIPTIFNPQKEIPVRKHLAEMSDHLWAILDEGEKGAAQTKFNRMFWQVSDLHLLGVSMKEMPSPNVDLALDLVSRGLTDLTSATHTFLSADPHAIVWDCQQAVEKYLKAFLTIIDEKLDEARLKKLGHDNVKLLEEAALRHEAFEQVKPDIQHVNFGPQDRYEVREMSREEGVDVVDLSFKISALVAEVLFGLKKRKP